MAIEIERKFLVDQHQIGKLENGITIKQGYISTMDNTVVRVRISDKQASLTLKGENKGISRLEFDYKIPLSDAEHIISALCNGPIIEKTRYLMTYSDHTWEVDVFHGDNDGLVIAEIELNNESEEFNKPHWAVKEVSDDSRYYNSSLLDNPFKNWQNKP